MSRWNSGIRRHTGAYSLLCEQQFGEGAEFDGEMCACRKGYVSYAHTHTHTIRERERESKREREMCGCHKGYLSILSPEHCALLTHSRALLIEGRGLPGLTHTPPSRYCMLLEYEYVCRICVEYVCRIWMCIKSTCRIEFV